MGRILFLLSLPFLLLSCKSQPSSSEESPPIPVLAVHPREVDITPTIETLGVLKPYDFAQIQPQVEGRMAEVLVEEGAEVAEGTPLFKIDPEPYLIQVQEAEAGCHLHKTLLEVAQKKLERYRKLSEKEYVTAVAVEEKESEVEQQKAALMVDEARLNRARINLRNCTLKAPFTGFVGTIHTYKGHLTAPKDILGTVSKLNPLVIEFHVTEKEAENLFPTTFELQSLCTEETCGKGKITFLDDHFDPKTALLLIRGTVENTHLKLRPGQTVRVLIPIGQSLKGLSLPQKAVKYNAEGPYVYIVNEDNLIAFKPIVLGETKGTDVIIKSGLLESDLIVTDGHMRLGVGSKVVVKP